MSEQTKQSVCPAGVVKAICISDKRGIEKKAIEEGHFLVDFGIEGDAHAGRWHRQVSLLSYDTVSYTHLQVTADDLAALGQGGLCLNCPECTFPNCGFGKGM